MICMLILRLQLFAQDDHGHSHDEPTAASASSEAGLFILYAESQKYELTLKHGELKPGQAAELTLYVADYATNHPLEGIEIKVNTQEDPSLPFTTTPHEPGVYHIEGTFPEAQAYSLVVHLNSASHGADLLLLKNVEVGKKLPSLQAADGEETVSSQRGTAWWVYGLIFLGGLVLGSLLLRRWPKALAVLIVGLSIPATVQKAGAHGPGGHDEEAGNAGSAVYIPKETQFLFELLTQVVGQGNFQPALEIYGTVVPSPEGFANVVTPQNGQVVSLKVTPGQKVTAGQIVATLKPSTNQSEQVSIATETGRLQVEIRAAQSELAAAEKELNRLNAIADIAAKKDVQAAEARFNIAKANLQALQSVAGGSVALAKNDIVLKSPITGTVGQFTLAGGAEVVSGTTLFSISNLNKVFIEARVYDRDAALVKGAAKYTVTGTNVEYKTADVRIISAAFEINETNQSQKILFELLNTDEEFKIGEFVTLRAFQPVTGKTIFIPNSSLSEINGKSVIFVKDAPEMYSVRYVDLGQDNGIQTTILRGIEQGERFATTAIYQVKMMMLNQ